jgi:hypothetical protein
MRDEYCFHLSAGGYPITFAFTAMYGSSYGICVNAARSWFERSIEDGIEFRKAPIMRGAPEPEPGEIGSPQFVCRVKNGVVTDARLFMNAEYYQRRQHHDRTRSFLVQWNVTPIPVEDSLKALVEETLWTKLQEIGFIIPRAEWEQKYPEQLEIERNFQEMMASKDTPS